MEKLLDSKSLRFICNQINFGIIDIDNIESVKIISDNKPNFYIRIVEVDLGEYVLSMFEKSKISKAVKKAETNFYDFIVFGEIPSEDSNEGKDLICVPLLELLVSGVSAVEQESVKPEDTWSLDTEEWSVIIE